MAFLDKLGQVANKVGEAASDAADLGKAKGKMVLEKGKLNDAYQALGKAVYEATQAGEALNAESLKALLDEVSAHLSAITELEGAAASAKAEFKSDVKSK